MQDVKKASVLEKRINNILKDGVHNMAQMQKRLRLKNNEIADLCYKLNEKNVTIEGFVRETERLERIVRILQGAE